MVYEAPAISQALVCWHKNSVCAQSANQHETTIFLYRHRYIGIDMVTGHLRPLVLLTLAKNERSGYQLMQHLAAELGHKPSPGSIYPLLKQLRTEGLVRIRTVGKAKEYSLTPNGQQAVRGLTADHHGLLDRIRDTLHMYQAVAGKSITSDLTEMFGRMRQGKPPFGPLTGEMIKLRGLALKATEKELSQKQRAEILKTFRKLNRLLRRSL